jgi:hypothetical protein
VSREPSFVRVKQPPTAVVLDVGAREKLVFEYLDFTVAPLADTPVLVQSHGPRRTAVRGSSGSCGLLSLQEAPGDFLVEEKGSVPLLASVLPTGQVIIGDRFPSLANAGK